jgi:hypothetical protein
VFVFAKLEKEDNVVKWINLDRIEPSFPGSFLTLLTGIINGQDCMEESIGMDISQRQSPHQLQVANKVASYIQIKIGLSGKNRFEGSI